VDALGANLGERVELEDHSQDHPPP
jgi:hypothetical protein